ncbi:hypothetical protein GN956_G25197 [Arapaima gigas]
MSIIFTSQANRGRSLMCLQVVRVARVYVWNPSTGRVDRVRSSPPSSPAMGDRHTPSAATPSASAFLSAALRRHRDEPLGGNRQPPPSRLRLHGEESALFPVQYERSEIAQRWENKSAPL